LSDTINKSKKRVFIADPDLQDWLGDNARCDLAIREGLEKEGAGTIILANKILPIENITKGIFIDRCFSRTAWGIKTESCNFRRFLYKSLLFFRHAVLILFLFVISPITIPYVLYRIASRYTPLRNWGKKFLPGIFRSLARTIKLSLKEMYPPHWMAWVLARDSLKDYYELIEVLDKHKFGVGDIVFAHIITEVTLPAWGLLASNLSRRKISGELVLLFRYPRSFLTKKPKNTIYFRLIEKAFLSGKIRGAVDSEPFVREYADFLTVPLIFYPVPLIRKFAITPVPEQEFYDHDMTANLLLNGPAQKPLCTGDSVLICYPWYNFCEQKDGASKRVSYLRKMLDNYNLIFFLPPQEIPNFCQVRIYNETPKTIFYWFCHLATSLVWLVDKNAVFFIRFFRNHIRDRDFRLKVLQSLLESKAVIVEYPFYMNIVVPLAKALGLPVLMTAYDRHALVCAKPVFRKMIDTWEKDAACQANLFLTVAQYEHDYFHGEGIENILSPNSTDIIGIRTRIETKERRDELIYQKTGFCFDAFLFFVGSSHPFNIDAKEAIKKIAAQAKAKGLIWHFVIAGGCASPNESTENVHALGLVDEDLLCALYSRCSLVVSPLPGGTGASVKTVEAMGIGKVVFGSRATFRGLQVTDGVECFIEDDLDKYIPRLEVLLRQDSADILQAVAIRAEKFAERYDYRVCMRPYVDFLESRSNQRQTKGE
jgi:hypothetical protein